MSDLIVESGNVLEEVKESGQSPDDPDEAEPMQMETVTVDTMQVDETVPSTNKKVKVTPAERLKCPECQRYTCETEEKMLRHIRKNHRGENPFQCYMCDYSTYNKVVFEEHVFIHQGIKPYKCSHCAHRSASKKNMKRHELRHRSDNPLKCTDCDFIAHHYKGLRSHRMTHTEEKTLKCDFCRFKTKSADELSEHKRKHQFACKVCKFKGASDVDLENHCCQSVSAKKEKEYWFTCALCKWTSKHKARILLHLIHHPNQEVHKCIDVTILKSFGIMK